MYIILEEELEKFLDILKLRWVIFNPDKTLKVFAVPDVTLRFYHPDTKNKIQHVPAEKYLVKKLSIDQTNDQSIEQ